VTGRGLFSIGYCATAVSKLQHEPKLVLTAQSRERVLDLFQKSRNSVPGLQPGISSEEFEELEAFLATVPMKGLDEPPSRLRVQVQPHSRMSTCRRRARLTMAPPLYLIFINWTTYSET
jgi:hypothetical protein